MFLEKSWVKRGSSREYDGLNLDDRVESVNVPGVYHDLQRNTHDSTGKCNKDVIAELVICIVTFGNSRYVLILFLCLNGQELLMPTYKFETQEAKEYSSSVTVKILRCICRCRGI